MLFLIPLAVLFILTVLCFGISMECMLMLFFVCMLYLISVRDIYDRIIPDSCLLTAIAVRMLYFCFLEGFQWKGLLVLLGNGLAVSLPLLLLVLLTEKIWKKAAMGGGDIKLIFVTGLYIGWEENLLAIFIAGIVGIAAGVRQMKKTAGKVLVPFGPAIAVGTVFSMLVSRTL